jgi:hypothetical protein
MRDGPQQDSRAPSRAAHGGAELERACLPPRAVSFTRRIEGGPSCVRPICVLSSAGPFGRRIPDRPMSRVHFRPPQERFGHLFAHCVVATVEQLPANSLQRDFQIRSGSRSNFVMRLASKGVMKPNGTLVLGCWEGEVRLMLQLRARACGAKVSGCGRFGRRRIPGSNCRVSGLSSSPWRERAVGQILVRLALAAAAARPPNAVNFRLPRQQPLSRSRLRICERRKHDSSRRRISRADAEQSPPRRLNRHVSCGFAAVACSVHVARARRAQGRGSWLRRTLRSQAAGACAEGSDWQFEINADGYRTQLHVRAVDAKGVLQNRA